MNRNEAKDNTKKNKDEKASYSVNPLFQKIIIISVIITIVSTMPISFSIFSSQDGWPMSLWASLLATMPIFFLGLSYVFANKNQSKHTFRTLSSNPA